MVTMTQRTQHASVLHLTGRMTADRSDERLPVKIERLFDDGVRKLVLDLRAVSYMDSTCLGEIIEACLTLRRRGGHLSVVNVPSHVQRLFDISHVTEVLAGTSRQSSQ